MWWHNNNRSWQSFFKVTYFSFPAQLYLLGIKKERKEGNIKRTDPLGCNLTLLSSACDLLLLVSCLAYSLTLKMETVCCPESSSFLWTTQHYKPYDHTVHSHSRKINQKQNKFHHPKIHHCLHWQNDPF
jgi:hypothetical protein